MSIVLRGAFFDTYTIAAMYDSTEDDRIGSGNVLKKKHTDFPHESSLLIFDERMFSN